MGLKQYAERMIKQKGSLVLKKEVWIPTSVEAAQKFDQHI